jgi:integrase
MFYVPMWKVEATKILTRGELATVLADLKRKAERSAGARLNLVIFRLACCCGLRVSEIAGLRLADIAPLPRVPVAGKLGTDPIHTNWARRLARGGEGPWPS